MTEKTKAPLRIEEVMFQIFKILPNKLVPDGTNKHFGYSYNSIQQIKEVVGQELKKNGVLFKFNVLEVNNDFISKDGATTNVLTTIKVEGHFTLNGGDDYVIYSYGQATDSQGKGLSKAKSDALKRIFTDSFLIGTEGEDEEKDYKGAVKANKDITTTEKAKSFITKEKAKSFVIKDPGASITDPQKSAIWAIAKSKGYDDEWIHLNIKALFNRDSIKELTKKEASEMIDMLQKE